MPDSQGRLTVMEIEILHLLTQGELALVEIIQRCEGAPSQICDAVVSLGEQDFIDIRASRGAVKYNANEIGAFVLKERLSAG